MNEDSAGPAVTHADISKLTNELGNLVVEMKNDRENRKESEKRHQQELDKIWVKVNKLDEAQVDIKTRLPTLEDMKETQKKILSSVVTALFIAAIIGGLTAKFAGT